MTAAPLKVFLAHPKGIELEELAALHEGMRQALVAMGWAVESITNSGAHWEQWFAASGSWDAWVSRWSVGMGPDGRHHFDLIVLVDRVGIRKGVGKGVTMALKANRPVYWYGQLEPGQAYQFFGVRQIVQTGGNEAWPVFSVSF